ncbi:hypothetical protein MC7420_1232 [Coleofasciculus chthonoplastes PCC 7420]|uniref:Uncharacterized protein n=1 Tax=Coleofasciculus chthonoplastes PCC 7420 TaxID=118168 RepID=B4W5H1_9CYAN|nr:hypothetical protein MC7420_1232 [Coleofasciculus chthonoplastes PCC 7420]
MSEVETQPTTVTMFLFLDWLKQKLTNNLYYLYTYLTFMKFQ